MMTAKIEKAFTAIATIEELTRTIRLHCVAPDTAISELQKFVHTQDGGPEDRGTAYEARDALLTLRSAAASLIGDIESNLDALTIGLTPGEAQRALNEYADFSRQII